MSEKNCPKQKFAKCCKKRQQKSCPEQQLPIFTNRYQSRTTKCKNVARNNKLQDLEKKKRSKGANCEKFGQNNKLSETTMCKCVVWNDKLQKVIRNNNLKNDILGQFGNFAKKNAETIYCKKCDLEQKFVKKMLF